MFEVKKLLAQFGRTWREEGEDGGRKVASLLLTLPFWERSLMAPNPKSDSDFMAEHASWQRIKSCQQASE